MPLPKPKKDEEESAYMGRCMSFLADEDRPNEQKVAMCLTTFRSKGEESQAELVNKMDVAYCSLKYLQEIELGFEEDLTVANFYIPKNDEYEDFGEQTEEVSAASLWENIRKKKQKMGKKYRPAKPGDKDRPNPEAWKKAQSKYKYKNMKTGEIHMYDRRGDYTKDGQKLFYLGEAAYEDSQMQREQLKKMHDQLMEIVEYIDQITFEEWTKDMISKAEIYIQNVYDFVEANKMEENEEDEEDDNENDDEYETMAAEYQGRKVTLNKPFRTPSGPKKFAVYTKNESGNVVIVRFGDPNMTIKKNIPERRKSFRARHNCDSPGPKWKARYWSCKAW